MNERQTNNEQMWRVMVTANSIKIKKSSQHNVDSCVLIHFPPSLFFILFIYCCSFIICSFIIVHESCVHCLFTNWPPATPACSPDQEANQPANQLPNRLGEQQLSDQSTNQPEKSNNASSLDRSHMNVG
jgi:hypothetical protein